MERDRGRLGKIVGAGILGLALVEGAATAQAARASSEAAPTPISISLAPGEIRQGIFGPAIFTGDIVVDGFPYYSGNDPKRGVVVELPDGHTHTIYAPFGASGKMFPSGVDAGTLATEEAKDMAEMRATGCNPTIPPQGCTSVDLVRIPPGDAPTTPLPITPTSSSFVPFVIQPGDTAFRIGPLLVQGDVAVNDTLYWDSDPKSGTEVELSTPGKLYKVYAPNGASGEQFAPNVDPTVFFGQEAADMANTRAFGCDPNIAPPGCSSGVNLIRVP